MAHGVVSLELVEPSEGRNSNHETMCQRRIVSRPARQELNKNREQDDDGPLFEDQRTPRF